MIIDNNGNPTKQLFLFLKYNKIFREEEISGLSETDNLLYQEFCKKWNLFIKEFEEGKSPSSLFGGILSIFGLKRHYCGTCGLPIIGHFSKIGSMITCPSCYESYQIIQELEKKEKPKKEKLKKIPSKKKEIPNA